MGSGNVCFKQFTELKFSSMYLKIKDFISKFMFYVCYINLYIYISYIEIIKYIVISILLLALWTLTFNFDLFSGWTSFIYTISGNVYIGK